MRKVLPRLPASLDFPSRSRARIARAPSAAAFRRALLSPVAAARRHRAGQRKAFEQEVAIVAQEAVNTNQAQQERRVFVAAPHARTAALRAPLRDHRKPPAAPPPEPLKN